MRAVTGRRFSGRTTDFREAPEEYAAIMFHDDDLADAGWEPDLELDLPGDLPSGVYALRLEADGASDHIPFAVRPPRGQSRSPVALLLPTLSHLAYANEHGSWLNPIPATPGVEEMLERVGEIDRYAAEHRLLSIYERHTDGSGRGLLLAPAAHRQPAARLRHAAAGRPAPVRRRPRARGLARRTGHRRRRDHRRGPARGGPRAARAAIACCSPARTPSTRPCPCSTPSRAGSTRAGG